MVAALHCVLDYITGANVPSSLLAAGLFSLEEPLSRLFLFVSAPEWIRGIFVDVMFRTLALVVSVMLPPIAIFFPLFTLLEYVGYLPRIAFNLDNFSARPARTENRPSPCAWDLGATRPSHRCRY